MFIYLDTIQHNFWVCVINAVRNDKIKKNNLPTLTTTNLITYKSNFVYDSIFFREKGFAIRVIFDFFLNMAATLLTYVGT